MCLFRLLRRSTASTTTTVGFPIDSARKHKPRPDHRLKLFQPILELVENPDQLNPSETVWQKKKEKKHHSPWNKATRVYAALLIDN